ncbi:MAG: hypothetical protein ACE3K2_01475 [Paenibacillus sp.]|uniref:hypothetical protein n=1 Tax=Paenibacillus sp. TaxID=58172 RepID=UPI003B7CC30E
MKMIIGQPRLEHHLLQLESELKQHPDADVLFFPEGYLNQNVEDACRLAAEYGTMIVSGHRSLHERPKDRSIIISKAGEIVLEKAKYTPAETVVLASRSDTRTRTILLDRKNTDPSPQESQQKQLKISIAPSG